MANMIELFEENVERNQYSHGFELIEVVTKEESVAGKIADIISEDGADALFRFKKGLELNRIDLDLEATNEENLYVCTFNIVKGFFDFEPCMGVYTKTKMVEYLKRYIQRKLKEEIFPTLNLIQQFMKTKEHSSLKIELFDCETEQDPDVDNMSVLVNADNNFTAKFVYNYHNETYSTTITKTEEEEYEIDDLTEAYAVFSNIFPYNEWEVVNDPIYNWIEENK